MIGGLPDGLYWSVGAIGVAGGLISLLAADKLVRGLRRWLLRQLRWVRTPGYRTYLKINGWALFGLGLAMLVLMSVRGPRPF